MQLVDDDVVELLLVDKDVAGFATVINVIAEPLRKKCFVGRGIIP
jgi:hypothetical protein